MRRHLPALIVTLLLAGCAAPPQTWPIQPVETTAMQGNYIEDTPDTGPSFSDGATGAGTGNEAGAAIDEVVDAFTQAAWTLDTATDTSPADALGRASSWMSDQLRLAQEEAAPAGGQAWWITLTEHAGYTAVSIEDLDEARPEDTATAAYRARIITSTDVGRDGWIGPPRTEAAYFTLTNIGGRWRIDDITIA